MYLLAIGSPITVKGMSNIKAFAKSILPSPVVRAIQRRGERRVYEANAAIGRGSSNPWIDHSSHIGGWLFPGEHEFLYELALNAKPIGDVLEIGTWMGKSACLFSGASKERARGEKVICVDTFCMDGTAEQVDAHNGLHAQGTFYEFLSNAKRHGFADTVVPVACYSTDALPRLNGKLRMAFVDGAHDRENCQRDVDLCLPLLASGGVLALHDCCDHWPGVVEVVAQLRHTPGLREIGIRGTVAAFEKH
jgi:predicted O-methyltransferase YrrM